LPYMTDLNIMRGKIGKAVIEINGLENSLANATKLVAIKTKLEWLIKTEAGDRKPENLGDLTDQAGDTKEAGNNMKDVLGKFDTIKKARYYDFLTTKYDKHVQYFIDELEKKIQVIKDANDAEKNLAFTIGADDGISSNPKDEDDIVIILSNRKKLHYLDFKPVTLKVSDDYKDTGLRKYLKACQEILSNPNKHKELLKRAKELYNNKIESIFRNKEKYLGPDVLILNDMSFEDCLKAEISGRRASFACAALARAFAELESLPLTIGGPGNLEILDKDDSGSLKVISGELTKKFLDKYLPKSKGVK